MTKIYFINLYLSYGLEIYLTILVLHMTNSTKTTKISSIFLAAILVAGTITAVYPSFVIGAEAQSETYYGVDSYKQSYGKDNSYKSKDSSSALLKKIKCNNIDVNVNGLEITALPPSLSGLLTDEAQAADEGERGASSYGSGEGSYGSGGQSGYDNKNSFKFVCINNNNNTVVGGEEEPEVQEPEPEICEECFAANSTLRTEIIDALVDFEGSITISGPDYVLAILAGTNTIEQLCAIIESSAELYGGPIPADALDFALSFLLTEGIDPDVPALDALIECLLEAVIIVEEELPPPPMSISDNGLRASGTVQCTGDPLCARLQ
jgi:hypothetical protein